MVVRHHCLGVAPAHRQLVAVCEGRRKRSHLLHQRQAHIQESWRAPQQVDSIIHNLIHDGIRKCASALQAANKFTFSNIVKTTYTAVKINIAPDGSATADTTDTKFATTTLQKYSIKSFLVALNYASAATCAPLAAHGTGVCSMLTEFPGCQC
jgi:hypothetical protein